MEIIRSKDGTPIAYWHSGRGAPLLLVHGTTGDHLTRPPVVKMSLANPHSDMWRLGGGECSERRGPGLGSGDIREPGGHSHEVQRGGNQQMHQPSFH